MATRISAKSLPDSRHPLTMLGGLGLCLLAFYLMLCLMSYNQADPSFNRATGNAVANAGGYSGALIADLTLQIVGLAGALLVLVPAAWGAKMMRGQSIPHLWVRFSLLVGSLILCAALLSL